MVEQIKKEIEDKKHILITAHINPDGDAIGSSMALSLGLKDKYKDKVIDVVLQDKVPTNFMFMPKIEDIKSVKDVESKSYDLSIIVDVANYERIGKDIQNITENIFKINIDHHISNTKYGDINIVENISSTSELIYKILGELDIEITKEMGEYIYLGIVNDTGNYLHDNVSKETFIVASKLIEKGVNNNKIVMNAFRSKSLNKMKVLGKVYKEMMIFEEKGLVYAYIPYSYLKEIGADKDITEGLVEELLSYENSRMSLFLRGEANGMVKGSMRSKSDIDVNQLASHFGGGGHIKAAGFSSSLKPEEILQKVLKEI